MTVQHLRERMLVAAATTAWPIYGGRASRCAWPEPFTSRRSATGLPSAIVGHVSFMQDDMDAVLDAHAKSPLFRGMRSKPVTAARPGDSVAGQTGTLQDGKWLRGLAALATRGLSWDLRVPFWHLEEAAAVVAGIPGIPVALNHCGLPLALYWLGAAGLVLTVIFQHDPSLGLLGLCVATAGIFAIPPLFWNLPTALLSGVAAAGSLAVINSFANISGFFGPAIIGWVSTATGKTEASILFLAGALLVASALIFLIPARLVNRR